MVLVALASQRCFLHMNSKKEAVSSFQLCYLEDLVIRLINIF